MIFDENSLQIKVIDWGVCGQLTKEKEHLNEYIGTT